jgi:hypothetical protein
MTSTTTTTENQFLGSVVRFFRALRLFRRLRSLEESGLRIVQSQENLGRVLRSISTEIADVGTCRFCGGKVSLSLAKDRGMIVRFQDGKVEPICPNDFSARKHAFKPAREKAKR